jgi:hypothetical protein
MAAATARRLRKDAQSSGTRGLDSVLTKVTPDISRTKNVDTMLMQLMNVKLADNFQIREHSWPCLFHISELIMFKKSYWTSSQVR